MRMHAQVAFLALALGCVLSRFAAAETPEAKVLAEARRIVADAKESHYQHETHVDQAAGIYDVDCSGFLCVILKDVLPKHYEAVPAGKGHARPLALQFYEFFTAAGEKGDKGWKEIKQLKHAKPGDVLVWRLEEQVKGKDTGHVMIVDEAPVEDGKGIYRVVVLDSNLSPHADDTRKEGQTGVGKGTMWFVVDEEGKPVGYHWKLKNGKLHDMQIAIGRAVEIEHDHDSK
jgi:hypothetical protein